MPHFKDLNLKPEIVSALEKKGYSTPTPIQNQAIPHILEGKDFLGIAQTGTGKTAAFSLPILDNLSKSNNFVQANEVRTLILTPTRELASQIKDNIKLYGQDLNLTSGLVFGGVNINNQIRAAKQGFDILVATPGRLLDLMNQGYIRFSQLEIFVLDEADRMLDMGFIRDVKKIIAKLPTKRQTLFFSATMPKEVVSLANSILNNPVTVEVTPPSTTVEKIDQSINFVEKANKPLLLKTIIKNCDENNLFLVFSQTKHNANRIVAFLEQHSIKASAIHGNKSQSAREKALEEFRNGKIKVLVATDIAARGIDVPGITHVINYELPKDPESYVHRIGRTARAGKEGIAISFCDSSEKNSLKDIEKIIKMKITVDESHALHGVESSKSDQDSLPKVKRGLSGRTPSVRKPDSGRPASSSSKKPAPRRKFDSVSQEERPLSHFAKSRKWQDEGRKSPKSKSENSSRSKDPSDFGGRSVGFGEEREFKRSEGRPVDRKIASGKFNDQKPRFEGSEDRRSNPYKKDDRRGNFASASSESRFEKNLSRDGKRDSSGERKFGDKKFSTNSRGSDNKSFRGKSFSSSSKSGNGNFSGNNNGGRKPTK
ncbi:MAG: ATP-dependent RNA helicase RhlE [Lentimonas sp.]|jgi:ATP-dependent RNA helicase RhlE